MRVYLKCFAELARFCPSTGGEYELPEGGTAISLRERLGIPAEEVAVVFVNGKKADPEALLADGDTVSFFPEITSG